MLNVYPQDTFRQIAHVPHGGSDMPAVSQEPGNSAGFGW